MHNLCFLMGGKGSIIGGHVGRQHSDGRHSGNGGWQRDRVWAIFHFIMVVIIMVIFVIVIVNIAHVDIIIYMTCGSVGKCVLGAVRRAAMPFGNCTHLLIRYLLSRGSTRMKSKSVHWIQQVGGL